MNRTTLVAALAAALALAVPAASRAEEPQQGCGAAECVGDMPVVPSLDPEWSASFVPPPLPKAAMAAPCIPTDVIVYAPTDWLRFAQKMRANMSPCASYYVSIPPLAASKVTPRGPNQAPLIRALGPNFHAVNEVNVTAPTSWKDWVAAGKGTWYDAGVEARKRMDDPLQGNFLPSGGDTWAVNELTSAVRQGTGSSRQNMRDFVHGLYDGAGGPPTKGIVWVSGMSQATTYLDDYRENLKKWFADAGFWADMSQYVRFFSQEAYGRVDEWAVPGTTLQDRLGPTADYLEHFGNLASAGAYDPADTAAGYLATANAPIGNAAWTSPAYEWPTPPVEYTLAANYEAAQVYAFRNVQDARPSQSFGFAWSPTDTKPAMIGFSTKTAFILDRIAAAIHASDAPSADPGLAACGPDLSWCTGDLTGAAFNTIWATFHDWTAPTATGSTAVAQNGTPTSLPLSGTDPDPGQQLTYSIVAQPTHGTATTDGSATATYTAEPGYTGPDSFTFRAYDGWLYSDEATVNVTVYGLPDGGAFVVGDGSATGVVTFWSPSWWLVNTLSGGPAPASFKGFAAHVGDGWTASPGFDHPPATVPELMGVLVASAVSKDGSTISGDASRLVIVHVDAYDPSLIGRGTVVTSSTG